MEVWKATVKIWQEREMATGHGILSLTAVFVAVIAILGVADHAASGQKSVTIAVDRDENVYFNLVPAPTVATLTANILSTKPAVLYVRADSDVRAQAVSRVLKSAKDAGLKSVVFGNPPDVKRAVPVHLVALANPVELVAEVPRPGDGYAVLVDFDGTLYHAGRSIGATALDDALEITAARTPNMPIFVCYNRLTKFGAVSAVLTSAQQHGLKHTVLAVDDASAEKCQ